MTENPQMAPHDYQAIVALPVGAVGIRCSEESITRLDYLPVQPDTEPLGAVAAQACAQLRAWLDDPLFRFALPLQSAGTPFQRRVWQAISAVACGGTRTYGELAAELGSAPRAVGQACGANPFPIVVPCHRIVARSRQFNGGLGGFSNATDGYLLEIKRWLLVREADAPRSARRR